VKKLSPRAQKLMVALSQDEGRFLGADELLPEHILLAMLKSADGLAYLSLQLLHINVLTFQLMVEQSLCVKAAKTDFDDLPLSNRLKNMLDVAASESQILENDYIGTEHFLLALIREENSISYRFFKKARLSIDDVRSAVRSIQRKVPSSTRLDGMLSAHFAGEQSERFEVSSDTGRKKNLNSILSTYGRNLTNLARAKKLDPVVGREKEINRIIQILCRRTKNNPLLLGEPGVGKTAIVEGLAQRIANAQVPHDLLKKQLVCLDLAAMVAGTKYRGEFEERMKLLMKEVLESKNVILFIDEVHTVIGAGGPEGSMDASNIIKPALSRGELQCIGATTLREYRKYFEKDSALVRRFQSVKVEEPSEKDAEDILNGIKKHYEDFHGVIYDEEVINSIVKFSERYVPERFLPDKAIDIMDEAGSAKKIQEEETPHELLELERSIEKLTEEKQNLVREQNYEKAAFVRDKVKDLRQKLDEYRQVLKNGDDVSHKKKITVEDICNVISEATGIPVNRLDDGESSRLLNMEEELHREVVGQDEAVSLISGAVRRSRAGVRSHKRPIGSFIFLGPTGVGKTQLAKTLAKFLFGSEDALIRIDMSDFMEKHNASKLVGAPPGYVGYEEGGLLTEKVRQHPYSVVLLDEIEKAHPEVFNLLLQLLEEGELTDNLGHTVSFKNTLILMTSNAGARQITAASRVGFFTAKDGLLDYGDIKSSAMEELKKILSPELLNRVDDVIVFSPLNRTQLNKILDIQLRELEELLAEKNLTLTLKESARNYMIENGYEPSMGARPMRRLIERDIEDKVATLLLAGENEDAKEIIVDLKNGELNVRFKKNTKIHKVPVLN
jgi:ATP-dependent Clp protease ATP-binding subunit ClpC